MTQEQLLKLIDGGCNTSMKLMQSGAGSAVFGCINDAKFLGLIEQVERPARSGEQRATIVYQLTADGRAALGRETG